jgi:hypothetical protein
MFNKILLAAIAAGLWANVAMTFVARPAHAYDTEVDTHGIGLDVEAINGKVDNIEHYLRDIAYGKCQNSKLC